MRTPKLNVTATPRTLTGRGLAAFLRGLLPEGQSWEQQVAAIEAEAAAIALDAAVERVQALQPQPGSMGLHSRTAVLAFLNVARGQWCVECLTIRGRFAYWLHRRSDKHRPLTMREYLASRLAS